MYRMNRAIARDAFPVPPTAHSAARLKVQFNYGKFQVAEIQFRRAQVKFINSGMIQLENLQAMGREVLDAGAGIVPGGIL